MCKNANQQLGEMAKKNIGGDCKKCTLFGRLYYGTFKSNIKKLYCVNEMVKI